MSNLVNTSNSDEILEEMRGWMEDVTIALGDPGVAGLNITRMRQAASHMTNIRRIMGATSRADPDDRPSQWPEGEGDPMEPRIDEEST